MVILICLLVNDILQVFGKVYTLSLDAVPIFGVDRKQPILACRYTIPVYPSSRWQRSWNLFEPWSKTVVTFIWAGIRGKWSVLTWPRRIT